MNSFYFSILYYNKNKKICLEISRQIFLLVFCYINNLFLVIISALFARPMGKLKFSTLRTLCHSRHSKFPICPSLISSSFRCFSLRYCHNHTSLSRVEKKSFSTASRLSISSSCSFSSSHMQLH